MFFGFTFWRLPLAALCVLSTFKLISQELITKKCLNWAFTFSYCTMLVKHFYDFMNEYFIRSFQSWNFLSHVCGLLLAVHNINHFSFFISISTMENEKLNHAAQNSSFMNNKVFCRAFEILVFSLSQPCLFNFFF